MQGKVVNLESLVSGHLSFPQMFSLNSANSATKIFVITVKGYELTTSCVRDQDATIETARHV